MNLANPCCKLMKYQGMLQESSLALSGSSATSSKTDYLAANKTITTDPHVKHLLCLSIHPSIMHLLPYYRNYFMTYKHITLIYIKVKMYRQHQQGRRLIYNEIRINRPIQMLGKQKKIHHDIPLSSQKFIICLALNIHLMHGKSFLGEM